MKAVWLPLSVALCGLASHASAAPSGASDTPPTEAEDAPAAPAAPVVPTPYSAWRGNAPFAPPPAIVASSPPPPDLPALEYARRPVELIPELLFGLPSCSAGSANNARCDGLGAGLGFGASALWRASPYFAFGGTLSVLRFKFDPPGSTGLQDGSAGAVFLGLLGRVYFVDHGPVEPYLELGFGGGENRTRAREGGALTYEETATGGALRIGGAVEFFLGRHLRLGPAFDWTRFRVRQLERCDASDQCAALDQASEGHGVGFTTLSARLTILLGPGM